MRELESSLQQFGEFLLRSRLVKETAAPYSVRWVRRFLTRPACDESLADQVRRSTDRSTDRQITRSPNRSPDQDIKRSSDSAIYLVIFCSAWAASCTCAASAFTAADTVRTPPWASSKRLSSSPSRICGIVFTP